MKKILKIQNDKQHAMVYIQPLFLNLNQRFVLIVQRQHLHDLPVRTNALVLSHFLLVH